MCVYCGRVIAKMSIYIEMDHFTIVSVTELEGKILQF